MTNMGISQPPTPQQIEALDKNWVTITLRIDGEETPIEHSAGDCSGVLLIYKPGGRKSFVAFPTDHCLVKDWRRQEFNDEDVVEIEQNSVHMDFEADFKYQHGFGTAEIDKSEL